MSAPDFDAPISPLAGPDITALAVSTSATLVRWSVAPSFARAFYRVLFTVTLLAPVALARHRDALVTISGRDLLAVGGAGVALVAHLASWLESFNHTTVVASITPVQSQLLFVAIGAWAVLDEHVSHRIAVGIGATFAGMALMPVPDFLTAGGTSRPLLGNGLAVVGVMMVIAYVLTGRSVRSRVSLVPYMAVVYSICTAVLLVVTVDRGDPLTGYPPRERLLFPGMAVGPGVFGHTVTNWALAYLESGVVSVSFLSEPVGSMILVLFLLGGIPMLPTVLGGAIVLSGIYASASRSIPADTGGSEPGHLSEDASVRLPFRIRHRP